MCNSKQVMRDRWNLKWRPPPSWIYDFCPFWSNGLFSVAAFTLLQNFIHLCLSAAELLLFVQKSTMAAAAFLNYNFVMLDHPRSPFVHLKFLFKFCVDRVRTFRDIAIQKFCKFGLQCLFRPPQNHVFGEFWPTNIIFYHRDPPKGPTFWAINGRDRSSGVTCRHVQEYKKRIEHKKLWKMPSLHRPFSRHPTSTKFCMWSRIPDIFLGFKFIKIGWKMWEL